MRREGEKRERRGEGKVREGRREGKSSLLPLSLSLLTCSVLATLLLFFSSSYTGFLREGKERERERRERREALREGKRRGSKGR